MRYETRLLNTVGSVVIDRYAKLMLRDSITRTSAHTPFVFCRSSYTAAQYSILSMRSSVVYETSEKNSLSSSNS